MAAPAKVFHMLGFVGSGCASDVHFSPLMGSFFLR
jgi:hypothetical protein